MAKSENEKAPDLIQVSGKSEYSSLKRSHLRSDLKEVKEWSMQISEWISQAGKKKTARAKVLMWRLLVYSKKSKEASVARAESKGGVG